MFHLPSRSCNYTCGWTPDHEYSKDAGHQYKKRPSKCCIIYCVNILTVVLYYDIACGLTPCNAEGKQSGFEALINFGADH